MDLAPYRTHRRILTASLVGTAVEFYDFYIYGTAAALVFGPLFFPTESASAQLLYSFMTFGLAFFARPVGAIASREKLRRAAGQDFVSALRRLRLRQTLSAHAYRMV